MLRAKYITKEIDIKDRYISNAIYVKNQFLWFNRDFIVVLSLAKYTRNESKNLISELTLLKSVMPKQNNSYHCIYVCECNNFPKDNISMFGKEWATHFLLVKSNSVKFEKDFWVGGAGKIKRCCADIAKIIINNSTSTV